jgi:hypothetical protein
MQQQYEWQFFRAGQDIAHIGTLDQAPWVALACPTRGIEFDGATLDPIGTSKDGRIRPPELVAACEWVMSCAREPQVLADGGDVQHQCGYGGRRAAAGRSAAGACSGWNA